MKIREFIDLINSAYMAELCTESFTEAERDKMNYHGEPEVDVGGHISGSVTRPGALSPTVVDFTLPSELRRLMTDFPVKKFFDLRDDADSDVKAMVYMTTVAARMQAARTTLMATTEYFLGEYIINANS